MEEIWKDIAGYEGLYQVSNLGRVRSLDKFLTQKGKGGVDITRIYRGKVLKGSFDCDGYEDVSLSHQGKSRTFQVHRLVAQAFIPNPDNLPLVNHKDENPANNRVDNLEWCTLIYNCNYGSRNEKIRKFATGRRPSEESRKKMSDAKKGKPSWKKGMKMRRVGDKTEWYKVD